MQKIKNLPLLQFRIQVGYAFLSDRAFPARNTPWRFSQLNSHAAEKKFSCGLELSPVAWTK